MVITGLYAGILGLIYVCLSARVIHMRYSSKIAFGDAGSEILMKRVRVHGNFAEYIPLALILMGILDTQLLSPMLLHIFGIALVIGRLLHVYGLTNNVLLGRAGGMILTLTVIGLESVLVILHYVL